MAHSKVLVLGAGPAGLTVASKLGGNALVLEKFGRVGGLSRSIEFCGATFDLGGHSFHTPHDDVKAFVDGFMGGKMVSQKRDARVQFSGQLIPYPFQHSFHALEIEAVVSDCLGHEPDPRAIAESAHFEEWIMRRFGDGIARHFMLPYNRKLWARDLSTMSCEWVIERIATDKGDGSAEKDRRKPLQSDSFVSYPAEGGFGEMFEELARHCHSVLCDQEVIAVDARSRTARTRSGHEYSWDRLVTTMPLPTFLGLLRDCDPDIKRLADGLEAVSLKVLMLSVSGSTVETPQRIYNAEAGVHGHKIAFNHTSSPSLRAKDRRGVMCEISYSGSKAVPDDATLVNDTWSWLHDGGFVSPGAQIAGAKVVDLKYGYPVYTPGRANAIEQIGSYLESLGIHTVGRFGAWAYANSDGCMRQALELVETSLAEFKDDAAGGGKRVAAGSGQAT